MHAHTAIELFVAYFVGQAVHTSLRAGYAVRSKSHPSASRWDYIRRYWDLLLARSVAGWGLLWLWMSYPDGINHLLGMAGLQTDFSIPQEPVVMLMAGLFGDVVLDRVAAAVPWFHKGLADDETPPEKKEDA